VERIFGDVGGWCRREGELVVGRGRGWSMRRRGESSRKWMSTGTHSLVHWLRAGSGLCGRTYSCNRNRNRGRMDTNLCSLRYWLCEHLCQCRVLSTLLATSMATLGFAAVDGGAFQCNPPVVHNDVHLHSCS